MAMGSQMMEISDSKSHAIVAVIVVKVIYFAGFHCRRLGLSKELRQVLVHGHNCPSQQSPRNRSYPSKCDQLPLLYRLG